MGADGHITIYNYEKIKAELGEEPINRVLSSTIYLQEMERRKYLTVYHGDNLYEDDTDWDERFAYTKPDSPYYVDKEKWESWWKTIRNHRITDWEVWT